MILTDREIESAISSGQIGVTPQPSADAYSSTSLDLTLGEQGEIWKELKGQPIRPHEKGYSFSQLTERKTSVSLNGYTFRPNSFLLAWTTETIEIKHTSRLAARVEGKSSLARLGVGVHITAPTIHAGFKGQIQLEMFNTGPNEIILDVGMKVCQIIFEATLGTPSKGYAGQFSGQRST